MLNLVGRSNSKTKGVEIALDSFFFLDKSDLFGRSTCLNEGSYIFIPIRHVSQLIGAESKRIVHSRPVGAAPDVPDPSAPNVSASHEVGFSIAVVITEKRCIRI